MAVCKFLTPDHLDSATQLLSVMFEESPAYKDITDFEWKKVRSFLLNHLEHPKMAWVLENEEGKVVGIMGCYVTQPFWSYDVVVNESIFYVHPDYRGTMGGVKLIKKLEAFAEYADAVEVNMTVSSGIRPLRTVQLLARMGFENNAMGMRKVL